MQYRPLGRTGWNISTVSFGAWAIGGTWGEVDDKDSMAALHRALDLGVNFFDTADVYGDGRSERLLARLRKERSEPFYVATKAGRRLSPHVAAGFTRANLTAFVERSLQNLERTVSGQAAPARLAKLLRAELAAAQGRWDAVPALLARQNQSTKLERPELIATAQAVLHLPPSATRTEVLRQLRDQVLAAPLDAQAWNTLANVLAVEGQALPSLRAEGEAQMARMDWQGAIDRFRAAQDWAKKHQLQAGDHIEASIVDTRLRQAQALVREMQAER